MTEVERKYIIKDVSEKIDKLKRKSLKKIGIIQWYENSEELEERIRLTISYDKVIGHTYFWEKTTKKPTNNPQERIEDEKTLDPRKGINLSDFENKKSVFKIRYILKEDPEIVLDEFLKIDNSNNLESIKNPYEGYYLEIEERQHKCDFEQELKNLNLELGIDLEDVTGKAEYKNSQRAKQSDLKPLKMIEYVQNRLIGPVTVILTQGISKPLNPEEEIKKVRSEGYTELLPETDALYLFMKSGFEVKKSHFLVFPPFEEHTDYPKYYDSTLKKLVIDLFKLECTYSPINYDPSEQDSAYGSFREISDSVSNAVKNDENILIDLTGGQKYPGIELAIYSLFNKKAFYYKQKNEMVQLKFPPLPIGWNYELIDDNQIYFKNLSQEKIDYSTFATLPEFLKDLFSVSEDGELITIPIVKEITDNYKNARKMPFGHGKNFIDLIRDEKMIDFVNDKIPLWTLQWIGDLIPETVEHSQRHSKRLMEFAFSMIRVMGEENFLNGIDPDLKKVFYFILAVAMNVHDLGHTVLNYKTDDGINFCIDGLPSIVRDLHSELSYQLLESGNLLDGIDKISNDKLEIERLKKAIMYVSKYHRQYLPIGKEEKIEEKEFTKYLKMKIKSLEERLDEDKLFENTQNWKDMIMLAARWLKFIDSTDVQSDRTVMNEYNRVRIERTKEEIKSLCHDFLVNSNMLCKLDISGKISNVLEYLGKESWEDLDNTAKEIEKFIYENIGCDLENAIAQGKNRIFVDEYLKKLDRIAFKSRQFLHFKKHQAVESIMPEFYDPKNGELRVKIYAEENGSMEIIKEIRRDIENEFRSSHLNKFNKCLKKLNVEV